MVQFSSNTIKMPKSCKMRDRIWVKDVCPFVHICDVYQKEYTKEFQELNGCLPHETAYFKSPMCGMTERLIDCPLIEVKSTIKIKAYDFEDCCTELEVPNDITSIDVQILSGDEVITVYKNDEVILEFDSGEGSRCISYYDGGYTIHMNNIEEFNKWMSRTSSYDSWR